MQQLSYAWCGLSNINCFPSRFLRLWLVVWLWVFVLRTVGVAKSQSKCCRLQPCPLVLSRTLWGWVNRFYYRTFHNWTPRFVKIRTSNGASHNRYLSCILLRVFNNRNTFKLMLYLIIRCWLNWDASWPVCFLGQR